MYHIIGIALSQEHINHSLVSSFQYGKVGKPRNEANKPRVYSDISSCLFPGCVPTFLRLLQVEENLSDNLGYYLGYYLQ